MSRLRELPWPQKIQFGPLELEVVANDAITIASASNTVDTILLAVHSENGICWQVQRMAEAEESKKLPDSEITNYSDAHVKQLRNRCNDKFFLRRGHLVRQYSPANEGIINVESEKPAPIAETSPPRKNTKYVTAIAFEVVSNAFEKALGDPLVGFSGH